MRSVVDALVRMGVDERALAIGAGLDVTSLAATARIPIETHHALWRIAMDITGDLHIGLHVGERVTFGRWGTLEYLLSSASSLRQAMQRVERYWRLVSDDNKLIALVESGDTAAITFRSELCEEPAAREADMVYALRFVRQLVDPVLVPLDVCFEHGPSGGIDEYVRVFGVTPRFSEATQTLLLSRATLDVQALSSSTSASAWAEQRADEELSRVTDDFASRVRATIGKDLRAASIETTASSLGMAVRSLQRHLASEGLAFRTMLDESKRTAALDYLASSELSLTEIGFRLGFSDPSAFSQAARRWFEATPAEVRRGQSNHGSRASVEHEDRADGDHRILVRR